MLGHSRLADVIEDISRYDIKELKDFVWDEDLDYSLEHTIKSLIEMYSFFNKGELGAVDLVDVAQDYLTDRELKDLLVRVKKLVRSKGVGITLEEYNQKIHSLYTMDKDILRGRCARKGLATNGTKSDLIDRLVADMLKGKHLITD